MDEGGFATVKEAVEWLEQFKRIEGLPARPTVRYAHTSVEG